MPNLDELLRKAEAAGAFAAPRPAGSGIMVSMVTPEGTQTLPVEVAVYFTLQQVCILLAQIQEAVSQIGKEGGL
jgi:hypothetical protein